MLQEPPIKTPGIESKEFYGGCLVGFNSPSISPGLGCNHTLDSGQRVGEYLHRDIAPIGYLEKWRDDGS